MKAPPAHSAPPASARSAPRRRKEARAPEILAAALAEFAANGVAATRIEDIAARAGTAKGTVYLYFASKDALFRALVEQAVVPNIDAIEAMVKQHKGPVEPLLRSVLARFALLLRGPMREFPRLIIAEARKHPEIARFYHDAVIARGLGLMTTLIRRAQKAGEFSGAHRPDHAVRFIMAPFVFSAVWATAFDPVLPEPYDHEAFLAAHVENVLTVLKQGAR